MAKSFREKVKEERENLGWTLEELAGKINSAKSYVWELENKPSARPSADKVFKLAEVFGVSADYLMDDTGRIKRNAEELDKAFFSKFQKLDPEHKKVLQRFMNSLDDE